MRRYWPERFARFKVLVYFAAVLLFLLLMLLIIRKNVEFPYFKALTITLYALIPFFIAGIVHALDISRLLKVAVDVLAFGVLGYRLQAVVSKLFETKQRDYYRVDLNDWINCINGNVAFIWLVSAIVIAVALVIVFFVKRRNRQ